ncbi:MAG: FAD-binding oxidoreductase [Rhizobiaceae bacterium]|nr:FAD-binding oxidoreductase [Rhizobiaceae bacterium]
MSQKNIAVIGAGILGSTIAYELANSGFNVHVFSDDHVGDRATPNSFGWINAHGAENAHHFKIRLESMRLWRILKQKHPALPVRTITAIDWDLPQDLIDKTEREFRDLGHSTGLLTNQELKSRFPHLRFTNASAIVSEVDLVADPAKIAEFFIIAAKERGAAINTGTRIDGIHLSGSQVELSTTAKTKMVFDDVVIAAGIGSQALVEQLGYELPMNNQKGALFRSEPKLKVLNELVSAPNLHCWQMDDGRIIAGTTQAGSAPLADMTQLGKQLSDYLAELAPELSGTEFINSTVGTRPQPADGLPVIDVVNEQGNIHLAVMHSGITLAPFVGKVIAHQVETGKQHQDVVPYSLSRFQSVPEKLAV